MELVEALHIVARHVLHNIATDEIGDYWEAYPEIGEHDWLDVQKIVLAMAYPSPAERRLFDEAYQLLTDRASEAE